MPGSGRHDDYSVARGTRVRRGTEAGGTTVAVLQCDSVSKMRRRVVRHAHHAAGAVLAERNPVPSAATLQSETDEIRPGAAGVADAPLGQHVLVDPRPRRQTVVQGASRFLYESNYIFIGDDRSTDG